MLFRLAFRNLKRNKRRTLITLASIAFGLVLSLTFTGMGDSGYTKMINGAARLGSGHLTILPVGYLETPSLQKTIQPLEPVTARLKDLPGVQHSVVRITGQAMAATARESVGAAFLALDPRTETPDSCYLLEHITEGTIFEADDRRGIVIGRKMADRLNARIGSKIILTTTDKTGAITSVLTRVRGIFRTGVDQVDGYFVMIPLTAARNMLSYAPNEATEIAVFLDDYRRADRLAASLRSTPECSGLSVAVWRETMPDMAGLIATDRTVNYLFQIIVFLLVAAGILNTILMSVMERSREFGIMLAVGLSPGKLFGMIFMETLFLGILGIVFGLILFAPLYAYLHIHGWDLSGWIHEGTDIGGVVMDTILYNDLRLKSLLIILSGTMIITLLAGIYPAWKAGRVDPVETIKSI